MLSKRNRGKGKGDTSNCMFFSKSLPVVLVASVLIVTLIGLVYLFNSGIIPMREESVSLRNPPVIDDAKHNTRMVDLEYSSVTTPTSSVSSSNHSEMMSSLIDSMMHSFQSIKFNVLMDGLPYRLYEQVYDSYNWSFHRDDRLSNEQYGYEYQLLNQLRKHPNHSPIRSDCLIFIIPNALEPIHAGDWEMHSRKRRYGRDKVKPPPMNNQSLPVWPLDGWPYRRGRYVIDLLRFINDSWIHMNDSLILKHPDRSLRHCLRVTCHFYTMLFQEWTIVDTLSVIQMNWNDPQNPDYNRFIHSGRRWSGGLSRIGIIANMHPVSAPGNSARFISNPPLTPQDYDDDRRQIIVPFYHDALTVRLMSDFQRKFSDPSSKSTFACAAFSYGSVNHSPRYRQNILTALSDHCPSQIKCESLTISSNRRISADQIFGLYSRSIFCAVSRGDIENGRRVYSIVISGCIPVLLGVDAHWLAFDDLLDWSQFSVIVPERLIDPWTQNGSDPATNWPRLLMDRFLTKDGHWTDQLTRMHRRIGEVRRAFIFPHPASDLIVLSMQIRGRNLRSLKSWLSRNGAMEKQAQVLPHFADQFLDRKIKQPIS